MSRREPKHVLASTLRLAINKQGHSQGDILEHLLSVDDTVEWLRRHDVGKGSLDEDCILYVLDKEMRAAGSLFNVPVNALALRGDVLMKVVSRKGGLAYAKIRPSRTDYFAVCDHLETPLWIDRQEGGKPYGLNCGLVFEYQAGLFVPRPDLLS